MADTITNISAGPRGLHTKRGFIRVEKGQARDVELTDVQRKGAEGTGYFRFGAAVETKPGKPDGARATRFAELSAALEDGHRTDDGKPEVHALNALLDDGEKKFTARERDALHEAADS